MEQKVKINEIPCNAQHIYVKLYCDRKGVKDKKTITEAKKSWLSLSLSKRKYFYRTSTSKKFVKDAYSLCETKAYLKEKYPKKHASDKPESIQEHDELATDSTAVSIHDSNLTEEAIYQSVQDGSKEYDASIKLIGNQSQNDTQLESLHDPDFNQECNIGNLIIETPTLRNDTQLESLHGTQHNPDNNQEGNIGSRLCEPASPTSNETRLEDVHETPSNADSNEANTVAFRLEEPSPPAVKIGKDLYELIHKPGDKTWKEMTRVERNHYNTAVIALKRQYLRSYITYLESLRQQQLYDHYMKTLYNNS